MMFFIFFTFVLLMIVNLDAFGDESYREVGFVNKYIVSKDGENF